jgi:hypothetical protein
MWKNQKVPGEAGISSKNVQEARFSGAQVGGIAISVELKDTIDFLPLPKPQERLVSRSVPTRQWRCSPAKGWDVN